MTLLGTYLIRQSIYYNYFRRLKNTRNLIHANLMISLFIRGATFFLQHNSLNGKNGIYEFYSMADSDEKMVDLMSNPEIALKYCDGSTLLTVWLLNFQSFCTLVFEISDKASACDFGLLVSQPSFWEICPISVLLFQPTFLTQNFFYALNFLTHWEIF